MPILAKTRENRGEADTIRFIHRLSRTLVLQKILYTRSVAEMMSGMIRERVIDQRDSTFSFLHPRAFRF